jgi:glycosyltransferase involved in cell wall biosynthesis
MKEFDITVLIPTFNGGEYLHFALDSLRRQTFNNFCVYIVDDGSADDTIEIAKQYIDQFNDFRIFEEKNIGIGGNWNRAVACVTTKYHTILHFDDEYHPQYLGKMKLLLDNYPNAAMGHCPAQTITKNSAKHMSLLEHYKLNHFFPAETFCLAPSIEFNRLLSGNFINCPSVMYRTAASRKVGRFNEVFSHVLDWDYWFRVLASGYQICGTKEILFYYRRHDENASVYNSRSLRRYSEEVELLTKVVEDGISRGWLNDGYTFSPVLQGGIMDISEDLVSGRKRLAEEKRCAISVLIGDQSLKTAFMLKILKLFVGMGRIGGYAIKTTVFLAITILGSVKS